MESGNDYLRVRVLDIDAGKPIVVMHEHDAEGLSIHIADRIRLCKKGDEKCTETAIVDVTDTVVKKGEIGIFNDISNFLGLKNGDVVSIVPGAKPASIAFIKKKLDGIELKPDEIDSIVLDIVNDNLSDIELASFVTASYVHGYSKEETVALTWAMVNTGDKLDFEGTTVDKHCIGGVPGNRTTMVVVPILASLGLKIPKTSSRAITSPAGTADTMEVLCNVNFGADDVKRIVNKIGACMVWGGALNLAPADDKIIKVEYPLSIDAEGQVLASIISKKKSVGSDYVLVDIPCGKGSKILDEKAGLMLGDKFVALGKEVDMKVKYVITDGTQPIGNGIGPALEAIDVLSCLEGGGPTDLLSKCVDLAATMLEFCGSAKKNDAKRMVLETLESGGALKKMRDIIRIQNGDPEITSSKISVSKLKETVLSEDGGEVVEIDNRGIAKVARTAGCPKDKMAGAYLHKKVGDKVDAGEELFTVYAQNKVRLEYALDFVKKSNPYKLG